MRILPTHGRARVYIIKLLQMETEETIHSIRVLL